MHHGIKHQASCTTLHKAKREPLAGVPVFLVSKCSGGRGIDDESDGKSDKQQKPKPRFCGTDFRAKQEIILCIEYHIVHLKVNLD